MQRDSVERLRRHLEARLAEWADSTIPDVLERIMALEAGDVAGARRILSDWTAPLLDELELAEAAFQAEVER